MEPGSPLAVAPPQLPEVYPPAQEVRVKMEPGSPLADAPPQLPEVYPPAQEVRVKMEPGSPLADAPPQLPVIGLTPGLFLPPPNGSHIQELQTYIHQLQTYILAFQQQQASVAAPSPPATSAPILPAPPLPSAPTSAPLPPPPPATSPPAHAPAAPAPSAPVRGKTRAARMVRSLKERVKKTFRKKTPAAPKTLLAPTSGTFKLSACLYRYFELVLRSKSCFGSDRDISYYSKCHNCHPSSQIFPRIENGLLKMFMHSFSIYGKVKGC